MGQFDCWYHKLQAIGVLVTTFTFHKIFPLFARWKISCNGILNEDEANDLTSFIFYVSIRRAVFEYYVTIKGEVGHTIQFFFIGSVLMVRHVLW